MVEGGRVTGVIVDPGGGRPRLRIEAPAVILATGGAGQLYRYTTNPPELTGDGLAMAARAGASLVDLEFVQFHPTALAAGHDPLPLLTEALRGEGAVVIDETGARFLLDVHRDAELAPRDVVARAIFEHQRAGHRVFLDTRAALGERIAQRFPTVYKSCRAAGIDPAVEPIPVTPAAHYFMGGVMVDASGRTTLPGLWACGEVSATGAHGANRLASNSLLEAVVFGSVAAADARAAIGAAPATARGGHRSRAPSRCASPATWSDDSPREPATPAARVDVGPRRHGPLTAPASSARSTRSTRIERELGDHPGELRNLLEAGRLVAARGPGTARDPRQPRALGLSRTATSRCAATCRSGSAPAETVAARRHLDRAASARR